jgi:hypothetical protein
MNHVEIRKFKEYLGDSVYASFDGYHVWLTTENGYGPSNSIGLDPSVLASLDRYVEYLERLVEANTPK